MNPARGNLKKIGVFFCNFGVVVRILCGMTATRGTTSLGIEPFMR